MLKLLHSIAKRFAQLTNNSTTRHEQKRSATKFRRRADYFASRRRRHTHTTHIHTQNLCLPRSIGPARRFAAASPQLPPSTIIMATLSPHSEVDSCCCCCCRKCVAVAPSLKAPTAANIDSVDMGRATEEPMEVAFARGSPSAQLSRERNSIGGP